MVNIVDGWTWEWGWPLLTTKRIIVEIWYLFVNVPLPLKWRKRPCRLITCQVGRKRALTRTDLGEGGVQNNEQQRLCYDSSLYKIIPNVELKLAKSVCFSRWWTTCLVSGSGCCGWGLGTLAMSLISLRNVDASFLGILSGVCLVSCSRTRLTDCFVCVELLSSYKCYLFVKFNCNKVSGGI